jgi:hypothetical protein
MSKRSWITKIGGPRVADVWPTVGLMTVNAVEHT